MAKMNSIQTIINNNQQLIVPAIITGVLLLITALIFIYNQLQPKANTVLFVGLAGSGKTTIFTRLINPANHWNSYTSMKENEFSNYAIKNGKPPLRLLDCPGSESFRKILYQKHLIQDRKTLRLIIFTVDSAAFSKKDVAEFLYDVLYEVKGSKIPVIVACNKQDIGHAKSGQLIEKSVEQEFGLINVSREAALSSTDGGTEKRILIATGRDFKWSDLKGRRVNFVECSTVENQQKGFSLSSLQELIESV